MTEQSLEANRYQQRLESAQRLADYDDLSDNSKGLIAQLAYDKDLNGLDFNEAVNAELVTHRRNIGTTALTHIVERPQTTIEQTRDLPRTFEEARSSSGHSIEDVVQGMQEIDEDNIVATFGSIGELSDSDKTFYENDFLDKHYKSIANITGQFLQLFPEKYRKEASDTEYGAYHIQPLFLQHDSPAYLKAKLVEGKKDKPTVRLYLNPELADATSVYADFLTKGLKSGLRFKSKIIRPIDMIQYRGYRSEHLDKGVGKLDPIVIYGYEESEDELLRIVEEIHQARAKSFKGRKIGGSPLEIADGFGVGAEDARTSGEESLTSSRMATAKTVLEELREKNPNWDSAPPVARKRAFANSLRKRYQRKGYNPDNIAFNL